MSKIEVNTIESQCGSTVTLGKSGDTVTLASGASQSGFGRTGTVNWDTTKKTASFTGVSGNGYFIDTTSSAITITLPASPSAGDIIGVKDYASTFSTNNLTLGRNSSNINGASEDIALSSNGQSVFLVYVDGTKGWLATQDDSSTLGGKFVTATGGNEVITCGNFKTHVFTSPGNFIVSCAGNSVGSNTFEYLVVAGGGGGGNGCAGGSGGGGGFRSFTSLSCASPLNAPAGLTASAATFPITVGAGGAGAPPTNPGPTSRSGSAGSNSVFSTITSAGGGKGAGGSPASPDTNAAGNGGSGGGGGHSTGAGGTGNTPPVSPPQGNDGAASRPVNDDAGGSGGGAGAAGTLGSPTQAANGGAGSFIPLSFAGDSSPSYGESGPQGRFFAGGAGGSVRTSPANPVKGTGGLGGGADGTTNTNGQNGSTNMGGGGSGGAKPGPAPAQTTGGTGGSGIVMIRYKFQ